MNERTKQIGLAKNRLYKGQMDYAFVQPQGDEEVVEAHQNNV
jgi:hypothetical protein